MWQESVRRTQFPFLTWYFPHKREYIWRGRNPGDATCLPNQTCQSCSVTHPTPHTNLYHRSQERMIWYVGQYPFWSEQWVRYVLLLCCHSDYWGDTEGLSWSGMREPAVWDSCVITESGAAWKPHTHTRTLRNEELHALCSAALTRVTGC